MKSMIARPTAIIMTLMLLAVMITGCADDRDNNDTDTTEGVAGSTAAQTVEAPNLEAVKYGGDVRFLYYKNTTWPVIDVSIMENSPTVLEDEIYKRNVKISDKYDINIVTEELKGADIIKKINNDYTAGDINYDVIMPQMSDSMKLATNGLLMNVNELPYSDYSSAWWNTGIMETSSIGGINYFAMGDMNLSAYDGTPIILFNKKVVENNNLESPYELVNQNAWTLDKMQEMITGLTSDLDHNGTMDEKDGYGIASNNFMADILLYGCNISFIVKDDNDIPVLSINTEKLTGIIEKLIGLASANNTYLGDRYGDKNQFREVNPQKIFEEERSLFFPSLLQAVSKLRGGANEFGILPTPKYDNAQESYVSYVHLYTGTAICIQRNYKDTDKIGRIIEDMTYESYKSIIPVYIDVVLKSKNFKDVDSGYMLDIVFDSYSCDLANILRGAGLTLGNDLRTVVQDGNNTIASLIASNKSKYGDIVEKTTKACLEYSE